MFTQIQSLWRCIIQRTPGFKFYITAKNTFKDGPPGTGGLTNAAQVSDGLTTLASLKLKRPPWLGWCTELRGMAEALLMMSNFWQEAAELEQRAAEEERVAKQNLIEHCSKFDVPIPLDLIWSDDWAALRADLEREGIRTWQGLLRAVRENPHPPLFEPALAALENNPMGEPPPPIVVRYYSLHNLLGSYGISTNLQPLVRTKHGDARIPTIVP